MKTLADWYEFRLLLLILVGDGLVLLDAIAARDTYTLRFSWSLFLATLFTAILFMALHPLHESRAIKPTWKEIFWP